LNYDARGDKSRALIATTCRSNYCCAKFAWLRDALRPTQKARTLDRERAQMDNIRYYNALYLHNAKNAQRKLKRQERHRSELKVIRIALGVYYSAIKKF